MTEFPRPTQTTDFGAALRDPSKAFAAPHAVLDAPGLDTEQKRRVLEQWELDESRLDESASEGMEETGPNRKSLVRDIHLALAELAEGS